MGSRRAAVGGFAIDRSRPLRFVFDGRELTGFAGDTLASALLANGVDVVCRSPLFRRPRGVRSAGVEEPCAFVAVEEPHADPVVAATMVELEEGLQAHGVPGVGRLPADSTRATACEHRHLHVELLVVGSGGEGVDAAVEAARRGDRVLLVEREPFTTGVPGSGPLQDVTSLPRATALGVYDDGYVVVHERSRPVERLWHVRARRVVLATGAHERPIAFADNDRPGVMLAGAARRYVHDFGVLPGERAVIFTTNGSALIAARAVREAGVEVAAVVDVRPDESRP